MHDASKWVYVSIFIHPLSDNPVYTPTWITLGSQSVEKNWQLRRSVGLSFSIIQNFYFLSIMHDTIPDKISKALHVSKWGKRFPFFTDVSAEQLNYFLSALIWHLMTKLILLWVCAFFQSRIPWFVFVTLKP